MNNPNQIALKKAHQIIDEISQFYNEEVSHIIKQVEDNYILEISSPVISRYSINKYGEFKKIL